jgi:peptidoglycan/LPS O-acetylase OafA/YrhL
VSENESLGPRLATVGVAVGSTGLIALASWDGADSFFSVGYTLAALCAAVLIAGLVGLEETGIARLFACRPAVALGRVSYGFYLWHLPVFRWTDDRLVGQPAFARIVLGLLLALTATVLSYRLLELPALRMKRRFASSGYETARA